MSQTHGLQVPIRRWTMDLAAEFGHEDVTGQLASLVAESGVMAGIAVIQLVGSTGAVTTIEYEPGALDDLRRAVERIAPRNMDYAHDARWNDGNGFSHVRSALLGTSLTIPIVDGELALGTWQQVIVLNLDNRPRRREVIAVVVGT